MVIEHGEDKKSDRSTLVHRFFCPPPVWQLAIAAAHHSVPFYVAAPATSIDLQLPAGEGIPIEERPAAELLSVAGQRVAAQGESMQGWGCVLLTSTCSCGKLYFEM